jgi:hypothetical protein
MIFVKNLKSLLNLGPRRGRYAELGVFRGFFAEMILKERNPRELHLIDGWETIEHRPSDTCGERRDYRDKEYWIEVRHEAEAILAGRPGINLICGDTSKEISKFPDHYFDFVYVDANHTLGGASADLNASAPKIRPGGFLGGHDLCMKFPGVIEAALKFTHQHPEFIPYAITTDKDFHSFLFRATPLLLL